MKQNKHTNSFCGFNFKNSFASSYSCASEGLFLTSESCLFELNVMKKLRAIVIRCYLSCRSYNWHQFHFGENGSKTHFRYVKKTFRPISIQQDKPDGELKNSISFPATLCILTAKAALAQKNRLHCISGFHENQYQQRNSLITYNLCAHFWLGQCMLYRWMGTICISSHANFSVSFPFW